MQAYRKAIEELSLAQQVGAVVGDDFERAQLHIEATLPPVAIAAREQADNLNALIDRLDPASNATRRLAAEQKTLDQAFRDGAFGEGVAGLKRYQALSQKLRAEAAGKRALMGSGGGAVVTSAGVNTVQSLVAGIPLSTTAATQGTQLLTLLQFAELSGAALAAWVAGITAVIALLIALGVAADNAAGDLREYNRVHRLTAGGGGRRHPRSDRGDGRADRRVEPDDLDRGGAGHAARAAGQHEHPARALRASRRLGLRFRGSDQARYG